jgi:hypothetical protein
LIPSIQGELEFFRAREAGFAGHFRTRRRDDERVEITGFHGPAIVTRCDRRLLAQDFDSGDAARPSPAVPTAQVLKDRFFTTHGFFNTAELLINCRLTPGVSHGFASQLLLNHFVEDVNHGSHYELVCRNTHRQIRTFSAAPSCRGWIDRKPEALRRSSMFLALRAREGSSGVAHGPSHVQRDHHLRHHRQRAHPEGCPRQDHLTREPARPAGPM